MKKKVLIVVDYQYDFVFGALKNEHAQAIKNNIIIKIQDYLTNDCEIIFTRDTHTETYLTTQEGKFLPVEHCIKGTLGWNTVIIAPDCSKFVDKTTFGYLDWGKYISQDVESIEIIGVCTDICVVSNALILKALFPETPISVDASCCAGVTPAKHNAALDTMESCQIYITNRA